MGRPVPAEVRTTLRAARHPATIIPCRHCGAREHLPCRLRTTGQQIPTPHDTRQQDVAVITTAVCPACQVETGIPCRTSDDRPYPGIHPQRRAA